MSEVAARAPLGSAVARAVAAFALHERERPIDQGRPDRPLGPQEWVNLLATCQREQTVGLLAAAVWRGWLPVLDQQAAQVDAVHASLMSRVVVLEQVLVAASARLSATGSGHRVLKGSAHAWLDWPDPSMRTFSDVDLLLANDYDGGLQALASIGCRRRGIEVHRGFDRRFGKGTTLVAPAGHEVDVHRTLAAGAYGLLIKGDELLEDGDRLVVGGREMLALGRPQRLVHACYHAALGDVSARHGTVRDVAELILGCEPEERHRALELAASWDGRAALAAAITTATSLLRLPPGHPLVRWAQAYEPTAAEQRRLRAYRGPGRSFAAQAIEGWRVLPTVTDRMAYANQLLFADPDHLRSRGESPRKRWARIAKVGRRRLLR